MKGKAIFKDELESFGKGDIIWKEKKSLKRSGIESFFLKKKIDSLDIK